jgi:tetratricopeptide (TPR) repeat protein
VRQFGLVVALMAGAAGSASAQLAVQVPTEKLLILAMTAAPADSATSIALADAVRDRIGQLAKYKVLVITKAKLCEALTASGFPCDVLLDDQQARQLSRFLSVSAYTTGSLTRRDATLTANVRVIDISSSGMPAGFSIANPGTTAAFAEAIAQRLNTIIRASESVRECTSNRQRGAFPRAISAAQKALTVDPNSAGAWLCISTVYEAQRMPVDSIIAASTRALKGDPCNSTAWENIARGWQQKNDSLKAIDAFISQLECEPRNSNRRMQIAQLLRQMKAFQRAVDLLNAGLKLMPGDQQMLDLKVRIAIEGSLWKPAVEALSEQLAHDSALGKDTTFLNTAIGAAQSAPDTQALLRFTEVAVRNFPTSIRFLKARGGAFEMAGVVDSAVTTYKKALALQQGNDVPLSLLIAKTIVDHAQYDTARARELNGPRKDTIALHALQQAFAEKVDSARPFLHPGLVSSDTGQKLTAAVLMLTGGSKIAQAAAYDRSYIWLDTLLQAVAPRTPTDTTGPRFQVRVNASFWFGLSSILTLGPTYQAMTKLPASDRQRCDKAKAVFGRLDRTKAALTLGRRVHPPTADQMLGFVAQYEKARAQVIAAFKCRNF